MLVFIVADYIKRDSLIKIVFDTIPPGGIVYKYDYRY